MVGGRFDCVSIAFGAPARVNPQRAWRAWHKQESDTPRGTSGECYGSFFVGGKPDETKIRWFVGGKPDETKIHIPPPGECYASFVLFLVEGTDLDSKADLCAPRVLASRPQNPNAFVLGYLQAKKRAVVFSG